MDLNGAGLLYALSASVALAWLRRPQEALWWALGWLAGLLLLCPWPGTEFRPPLLQIPTSQGALMASIGMGVVSLRQPKPWAVLGAAGALSAAWTSTLIPLVSVGPALLIPAICAVVTMVLQLRSPQFCPPLLRQEACLLLLGLGLVAGLVPDLVAGWSSGANLQTIDASDEQVQQSIQMPLLLSGVSLILGLLYARWRYR